MAKESEGIRIMYYLYGKRPDDKQFKPLNDKGIRVAKADAEVFKTREEAQTFLDNMSEKGRSIKAGCKVEIRKG